MIIAIDGPAGSGKSTVAKRVSERLGFEYLDTGAMYRAIAVRALEEAVALDDEDALVGIALTEPIAFTFDPGPPLTVRVRIGDKDVTDAIRTPEADGAVSAVARLPRVREAMVARQRAIGSVRDTVVEGRDIGTVVFPDAALKIFLTASHDERARRRATEQAERGHEVETARVADAIAERDMTDSTRATSPLVVAVDAIEFDTTGLAIHEVVDRIVALAKERRR